MSSSEQAVVMCCCAHRMTDPHEKCCAYMSCAYMHTQEEDILRPRTQLTDWDDVSNCEDGLLAALEALCRPALAPALERANICPACAELYRCALLDDPIPLIPEIPTPGLFALALKDP
jgi:hypothetical protein